MKHSFLTTSLFLLLSLPAVVTAQKVAFVYSNWSNFSFKNEFDNHIMSLGWSCDKYENTRLPELSDKLGEYDMVVAGAVANYTNTVDLKPYAAKWLEYLRNGGVLVVTDANYDSVLGKWVATLGPEFAGTSQQCIALTKGNAESKKTVVAADQLLLVPAPLGELLVTHYSHWGHLQNLAPQWQTPITCADGKPLFAYQEVGKGLIVLTVASSLARNPIGEALLKNIHSYQNSQKYGVRLVSFKREVELEQGLVLDGVRVWGTARDIANGAKVCMARLKADVRKYKELQAVLTCKGQDVLSQSKTITVDKDGDAAVSFIYAPWFRGQRDMTLVISSQNQELFHFAWQETTPRALEIKLQRKHLFPGNKLVLSAKMHLEKHGADKLQGVEWRFDDGAWRKNSDVISVDGLADGRHIIAMRLVYPQEFLASLSPEDAKRDWGQNAEAEFFKHPEPRYRMRDDHVLLEDGKPFFPFGFYHVSWPFTPEERLQMARDVASWGYNTIHVGICGHEKDKDTYGQFLDECAKMNIRVITEFGVTNELVIKKYKDKPAVMGWNPGDEPAAAGISAQEMFRRYDNFKQWDYNHIAYTVICVPAQYGNYAAGTDVLAPDPYPVPGRRMDEVYKRFKEAKAAANRVDTALWAVGQAFGGQGYVPKGGWKEWPNPRQFRGMSYLALMAGAKGIIYYVYDDKSFDIRKAPDLLEAAKAFPAEMKDLEPFILDGEYKQVVEDLEGGFYAGVWSLDGQQRLVVVNAADKPATASVAFSGKKLVVGSSDDLKFEKDKLSFTVKPQERIIFK